MEKYMKLLFIIIISIAFGYFWAYKAFLPYMNKINYEILALLQR